MSYQRKIEYTIKAKESFEILRNCSGCGGKSAFYNTNCFRVNANGNKIDVWLIYQCKKCKHTCNLTVCERCRPDSILKQEYGGYLKNSEELAYQYGTDSQFFARNKAEIDWQNLKYVISKKSKMIEGTGGIFQKGDLLYVSNQQALKIRTDKVVSEILNLTRSKLKEMEKAGVIIVTEERKTHNISIKIER